MVTNSQYGVLVTPRMSPPSAYSLVAQVGAGQVSVQWTSLPGREGARDWIGLYLPGAGDTEHIDWWYPLEPGHSHSAGGTVSPDGTSGTFSISPAAGVYELRFYLDNRYDDLVAVSNQFTVEEAQLPEYALVAEVVPGGIDVHWSSVPGRAGARDWIGLYTPGAGDMEHLDWWYPIDNGGHNAGGSILPDQTGGTFNVPITTDGDYEFRYFLNNWYDDLVAVSNIVTVGGGAVPSDYSLSVQVFAGFTEVSWSMPAGRETSLDWIGLFVPGEPTGNNWFNWWYPHLPGEQNPGGVVATDGRSGVFTIYPQIGTWDVRFHLDYSNNVIVASPPFEVTVAPPAPSPLPTPIDNPNVQPSIALPAGYTLVFGEEFNGTEVDPNRWKVSDIPLVAAPPSALPGFYRDPDAVSVSGGMLKIVHERLPGPLYKTGSISTNRYWHFTYGYYEFRFRATNPPRGCWMSYWMRTALPWEWPAIGPGVTSQQGTELDMMEFPNDSVRGSQLKSDVIWNGYNRNHPDPDFRQKRLDLWVDCTHDQWHTLGLLWEPGGYTYYLDGVPYWQPGVPGSELLNQIIISNRADDDFFGPPDPNDPLWPAEYLVDYFRVWQDANGILQQAPPLP